MKDPYSATLGGFSKVTGFLRDKLMQPEYTPGRPQPEIADKELAVEDFISALDINEQDEPGFEVVTTVCSVVLFKFW